ncbi:MULTISPECIES: HAD family hydrolase [unclassified Streptomyces]|uniref:HAD family hydrolase n=1 Tax=unclassified Streptomyces TaxID=2593676 RepID=UPI0006AECFA0|nr:MULTISPECIES: HAD-IA family hydrolase [unclassified Streptomyces]KOU65385.1 hydrolase [Streptomyces sp. IGB124]KOV30240.1 hydrolase [Streptomyces sp. H021]
MNELRAVVFDTDGVLLATADRHAAAWKETFDDCLPEWQPSHAGARPRPFDAVREYRDLVDGRSRLDGVRAFLAARDIVLPPGRPEDPPGCATVHAVAARKEEVFSSMLRTDGVRTFEDVRPALQELRQQAIRCAVVSASRHARSLLESADLIGSFDALVDGQDAAALALPGKPDPALFLEAADRLGVPPAHTAVVEDALAGVEAGHRGGFRLVVGLNREADPHMTDALGTHGADLVLPDLGGLPAVLQGSRP